MSNLVPMDTNSQRQEGDRRSATKRRFELFFEGGSVGRDAGGVAIGNCGQFLRLMACRYLLTGNGSRLRLLVCHLVLGA